MLQNSTYWNRWFTRDEWNSSLKLANLQQLYSLVFYLYVWQFYSFNFRKCLAEMTHLDKRWDESLRDLLTCHDAVLHVEPHASHTGHTDRYLEEKATCTISQTWSLHVQWNLVIKRSDITKPSYNKVILLVPALYISLFLPWYNEKCNFSWSQGSCYNEVLLYSESEYNSESING